MLALGIFLMLASVRAISFEDAVGSYCYADEVSMHEFVVCVINNFPPKIGQKVQELMDLFSGMTFFEAVQIMCKASMDSSAAMFDDFITMNVEDQKELDKTKDKLLECHARVFKE
ncbi:uncharacterized protein LOC142584315 isoform X3 [Dermacentor variabilis]|uniref:uncharacterized protein LOC142584315 isoform X3 n=1 Tax=Dermacentor variabilis TaxID=34621 RepID=UPI003F5C68EF